MKIKLGDRVRIIADLPDKYQNSIVQLMGREFAVFRIGYADGDKRRPDGAIIIHEPEFFGGLITLQPGEFEVVNTLQD